MDPYRRWDYSITKTLGFCSAAYFCIGYIWLVFILTGDNQHYARLWPTSPRRFIQKPRCPISRARVLWRHVGTVTNRHQLKPVQLMYHRL